MAGNPRGYAQLITGELARCCAGALAAAYLHGSAALGGWVEERSDVDILFIAADTIDAATVAAAAELLVASAADCPGQLLECSLVTASQARSPTPPWPFLLHVAAGPRTGPAPKIVRGETRSGDRDLLMHYAVCRARGVRLLGPRAPDTIGPIARAEILRYLIDELDWGLANAPESYVVLNASRALAFEWNGEIISKVDGGLAALERGTGPQALLQRALEQQLGRAPTRPPGQEAVAFVRDVIGHLAQAVKSSPGHEDR